MTKTFIKQEDYWPIFTSVEEMYDSEFLINSDLFGGGFVNFGFWNEIFSGQSLSTNDRLESGKNLYRFVLDILDVKNEDEILEIACGSGAGCALTLSEFSPKHFVGVDASNSQIRRAKSSQINMDDRVSFRRGVAEKLPAKTEEFSKIFSVEAMQHFKSVLNFLEEAFRVLKKDGMIVFATFFSLHDMVSKEVFDLIPTIKDGIDILYPISKLSLVLEKAGFRDIQIQNIGDNVWLGFDTWVSQGEFSDSWDRNWYHGYKQGHFDYFVVSAKKC